MTIHRGLAELKIIDSRIQRGIAELNVVGLKQEEGLVNGVYDEKEYTDNAKSKYQSVTDLIKRKNQIKSAIVKANGETMVEVGGKTMSIADAISFRAIVTLKKDLISMLKTQHSQMTAELNKNNETVRENADNLAVAALGKENSKSDDAVAITEPYIKKNEVHLVDPMEVEKLVEELQEEVDNFDAEIDAVLSEINATTFIEI